MTNWSDSGQVKEDTEYRSKGKTLKDGPIICQSEEFLPEENREKKDLTLAELNHVFKMFLRERGTRKKDISIVGQFSIIYDDPKFAQWHTLSKAEQSDSLSKQVIMPQAYDELIAPIGDTAGDQTIIKNVVKDAFQNAIDSFSHAATVRSPVEDFCKSSAKYSRLRLCTTS